MKFWTSLILVLGVLLIPSPSQGAFFSNERDIATHLDANYEPSGVVWNDRLQTLFLVSDSGFVTQMDIDGNIVSTSKRSLGLDLEGITIVDQAGEYRDKLYLLVEFPQRIVEFDVNTWTLTGRSWSLTNMSGSGAKGAEALTYNLDTGEFYVGSQLDGQIYVYNIDLSAPAGPGATVAPAYDSPISTGIGRDLAGLHYAAETKTTYAIFDDTGRGPKIREYDDYNNFNSFLEYDLPGHAQEGVTLLPGCPNNSTTIIIAQDSGEVMRYASYPIVCPAAEPEPEPQPDPQPAIVDQDEDGSPVEVDCDDTRANVNPSMVEVRNDGLDNDCNPATADWVRVYTSANIIPYTTTEVRDDYHVFDSKWEFSYVSLPAQPVAGWYTFDLEARATSLDNLYNLGINVRNAQGRDTQTRVVGSLNFENYRFYHYIPANTPTQVRFISGVRGIDSTGAKREHHLRAVTVTRVEEAVSPLPAPQVVSLSTREGLNKVVLIYDTDIESSATLMMNDVLHTNTDITTSKTWTFRNLTCGTQYSYELKLYSDLYNPVFDNAGVYTGSFTTANCTR